MEKIQPIEDFVFAGFSKRFQQVFDCMCVYTTANDKTKVLARMFEGREVTYPYAFVTLQALGPNTESYNPHSLARRGLLAVVAQDFAHTVRLMPANFELEIEYFTNKYQGLDQGSVLAFVRRWMFARRLGYLKFNIKYGRLSLLVASTLNDTVVPQRDSITEAESSYKTTATVTVHGYVSEPELGTQGVIQGIDTEVSLNANGESPNRQFFAFDR